MNPRIILRNLRQTAGHTACLLLIPAFAAAQSLPLSELRALGPVGAHPSGVEYYQPVMYANAIFPGADTGTWNEFDGTNAFGGVAVPTFGNARFDAHGYPKTLAVGKSLGMNPWSLNAGYFNRPADWPEVTGAAIGEWCITWKGRADVRLNGGSPQFRAADSNTGDSGLATDGRRVYFCPTTASLPNKIILHAIDPANPPTDIKVWLPDPANPLNQSLERPALPDHERLFHPHFIQRLNDRPWAYIRMMDLCATNNSPIRDWEDRRLPGHIFNIGQLNPRDVMQGRGSFVLDNQFTGIPWEHMVALCNQTSKHLWLCTPHLATPQTLEKLAKLIQFGSDGTEPYSEPQANPVWPPLNPSLKVFVEFSNEVWNAGTFGQAVWVSGESDFLGMSREQLVAARSSVAWEEMEAVLGQSRVVRVIGAQTGSEGYTRAVFNELLTNVSLLYPEVMAVTTYFGQNIQYFAAAQGYFDGRLGDDPYWQSPAFAHHLELVFDQWEKFTLDATAAEDPSGRADNVADPGGIPDFLASMVTEFDLPMLGYEGGGNFFTTSIDTNPFSNLEGSAVTTFMEALNRHPRFQSLYETQLEFARSKGLWVHMPFVLASAWGRFGQWGHLEFMDQAPASSVKYQTMLDWFNLHDAPRTPNALRHPHDRVGASPSFSTPSDLPLALVGVPYAQIIAIGGGNGALTWTTIASTLPKGMQFDTATRTLSGTPQATGDGRIFARVHDADGDPSWRVFRLRIVGGGSPLELSPVADAHVIQFGGLADTNLGSAEQFLVVNPLFDTFFTNPPNPANADGAKIYLKFDIGEILITGLTISTATLQMPTASPGAATNNSGVIVYETSDGWQENTITFNNRPAPLTSAPAVFGQAPPGLTPITNLTLNQPITADLTSYIQARLAANDGVVSVVIAAKDFANVPNLASREFFDPSRRPRLTLTLAGTPANNGPKFFTHQSIHNGEIHLAWPSAADVRLRRSTTLAEGDWQDVPGTTGKGAFSESVNAPKMFYHLFRPE